MTTAPSNRRFEDGWEVVAVPEADPLLDAWGAQAAIWPGIEVTGVLLRNTCADDVLLSLADGRVAEIHPTYHGAHRPTFDSLVLFASLVDWLDEPRIALATDNPVIRDMLDACQFLRDRVDLEASPYMAMGEIAMFVREGALSKQEQAAVFAYWNGLAETADEDGLNILAVGALELFNDDAASQRLARASLTGAALQILEDMRIGWGQPGYDSELAK